MASRKLLSKKEITKIIEEHPLWSVNKSNTKLSTVISFADHTEAMAFLVRLTIQTEVLNHHPDVLFTYKKLKISTTTHEVGGLTKLDQELVKRIDILRTKHGGK